MPLSDRKTHPTHSHQTTHPLRPMAPQHESHPDLQPANAAGRILTPENLGLHPIRSIMDIRDRVESHLEFTTRRDAPNVEHIIHLAENSVYALLNQRVIIANDLLDKTLRSYDWTQFPCSLPPRADPSEVGLRDEWDSEMSRQENEVTNLFEEATMLKSLVELARSAVDTRQTYFTNGAVIREPARPPLRDLPIPSQRTPGPDPNPPRRSPRNKRPREDADLTSATATHEPSDIENLTAHQGKRPRTRSATNRHRA
ncbi:hypothetical protein B0O80DRAFT_520528 [Mortierella sp. GBAus27b]|nr:hypothetical protein B0O80DRAFT_520528 [Mortierella sp. GBAus27b]